MLTMNDGRPAGWHNPHNSEFEEYERYFFADKLWYENVSQWREVLKICHAHWNLDRMIAETYAQRDVRGEEPTIRLCREQIELALRARVALEDHFNLESDYFSQSSKRYKERYPWKLPWNASQRERHFELPQHAGFQRLADIHEKLDDLQAAIEICHQAIEVGWPGEWDVRIVRLDYRLTNRPRNCNEATDAPTDLSRELRGHVRGDAFL